MALPKWPPPGCTEAAWISLITLSRIAAFSWVSSGRSGAEAGPASALTPPGVFDEV